MTATTKTTVNTDFTKCLTAAVRADKAAMSVSDTLLGLFKEHGSQEFGKQCTLAEAKYKAKCKKVGDDANLPRSWSQAKSDLNSAYKAGIDIDSCTSVAQAKRLKIEANKAIKEEANKANAPTKASAKSSSPSLSVNEQASGASKSNAYIDKLELIAEALDESGLSPSVIDALVDSFKAQVEKAISVDKATPATAKAKTAKPKKVASKGVTTGKAVKAA